MLADVAFPHQMHDVALLTCARRNSRPATLRAMSPSLWPIIEVLSMDHSKFIAGLAGPVALALGVSILVNRDLFPAILEQIQNNFPLIIVTGVLALVAGLAIVRTHAVWSGWPIVITIFGWLLVIGGLLRIVMPRQMAELATLLAPNPGFVTIPAVVLCLAGALLSYKAYS